MVVLNGYTRAAKRVVAFSNKLIFRWIHFIIVPKPRREIIGSMYGVLKVFLSMRNLIKHERRAENGDGGFLIDTPRIKRASSRITVFAKFLYVVVIGTLSRLEVLGLLACLEGF